MNPTSRRALPSVDRLAAALASSPLPRPFVVHHIRQLLADYRDHPDTPIPTFDRLVEQLRTQLATVARSRLQPVINATGVLAHTNLGRAPLAPDAVTQLHAIAQGYSNLELDLDSGQRGSRGVYLESALALLCQSQAATLVNNCAAALVLALRHFTRGTRREVIISRGELVQIGGGFRIPEILEASGARLREVGTTNRTSISDYARALGPDSALVLKVHRSNFYMEGFVESPSTRELASLAQSRAVPLLEDLGSGALVDLRATANLEPEPQPHQILDAGADLVCFSGDKLLGGPQCGILAGQRDAIESLKSDPFFRALRCDKLVHAALQATVEVYLGAHGVSRSDLPAIPMLRLLVTPPAELRRRAETLTQSLADLPLEAHIIEAEARIGGGVCPRSTLPSIALRLRPHQLAPDTFASRLRAGSPPVIPVVADHAVLLHLRTVLPDQDSLLAPAIRTALTTADPT